jgi:hypothetical protein
LGWQQWGQLGPLRIGQFSLCSCHGHELYPVVPSTLQTRPSCSTASRVRSWRRLSPARGVTRSASVVDTATASGSPETRCRGWPCLERSAKAVWMEAPHPQAATRWSLSLSLSLSRRGNAVKLFLAASRPSSRRQQRDGHPARADYPPNRGTGSINGQATSSSPGTQKER